MVSVGQGYCGPIYLNAKAVDSVGQRLDDDIHTEASLDELREIGDGLVPEIEDLTKLCR
jgi:hypothetical protein